MKLAVTAFKPTPDCMLTSGMNGDRHSRSSTGGGESGSSRGGSGGHGGSPPCSMLTGVGPGLVRDERMLDQVDTR
ncbi:hypothetical protein B566_EDAN014091 [Ephemera danica]|nr:hypothetical protein B566_EDAN014091 [Ephemera danica]